MLVKLFVRNYALIKELDLEFGKGLSIITGETGAGKSIMLGALSMILGSRADSTALLNKEEKCIVEGTFNVEGYGLESFFEANQLDYETITIIRREITPAGKSRAFINDTPVNLPELKEIGEQLIDIHSQHQNLLLNSGVFQLGVIDSYSGQSERVKEYRKRYASFRKITDEYNNLLAGIDKNRADFDYYSHQLKQIEEARFHEGEQEELESERELLAHAEEIKESLTASMSLLYEESNGIVVALKELKNRLAKAGEFLPSVKELASRAESVRIEINDLAGEVSRLEGLAEADPGRMQIITEKLDLLYTLLQKHRVNDLRELFLKAEELRSELSRVELTDDRLEELKKIVEKEKIHIDEESKAISETRKGSIVRIEESITQMLQSLGMPNGRFRIDMTERSEPGPYGTDHADFLFSANKQVPPENLSRVASGGELSRVMLSLKSLLSASNDLPTIIFDEIDSGVSGEVAGKVGSILLSMGKEMQVINITHLPQVAAAGERHFFVYKEETSDSTITRVKLLSVDERINEIARLLSGSHITDAAVRNARELIEQGTSGETLFKS